MGREQPPAQIAYRVGRHAGGLRVVGVQQSESEPGDRGRAGHRSDVQATDARLGRSDRRLRHSDLACELALREIGDADGCGAGCRAGRTRTPTEQSRAVRSVAGVRTLLWNVRLCPQC